MTRKTILITIAMLCAMTQGAWAQDEETVVNAYFTTDEMPDMMKYTHGSATPFPHRRYSAPEPML